LERNSKIQRVDNMKVLKQKLKELKDVVLKLDNIVKNPKNNSYWESLALNNSNFQLDILTIVLNSVDRRIVLEF
jgi:hypothetical protein